jgi:hypothetical protein
MLVSNRDVRIALFVHLTSDWVRLESDYPAVFGSHLGFSGNAL